MLTQDYRVWPKDSTQFSTNASSGLCHNYHLHPLFQLQALEELAHFLFEKEQCRFVAPDLKLNSEFHHQAKTTDGTTLGQVFERINEPKSWIALYNIQAHPAYAQLLQEIISSVRPLIEQEQKNIFKVGGFIFISSPPSVTPFHIDRENNFWLQMAGKKRITVFDHTDRELVSQESVEKFIVHGDLSGVRLKDKDMARGLSYDSSAGEGVYFPSTSPHMTSTSSEWVTPGDGISISVGVVFYTDQTRKQAQIVQWNNFLRKLGFNPRAPGAGSEVTDQLKAFAGHHYASLRSKLFRHSYPTGSY